MTRAHNSPAQTLGLLPQTVGLEAESSNPQLTLTAHLCCLHPGGNMEGREGLGMWMPPELRQIDAVARHVPGLFISVEESNSQGVVFLLKSYSFHFAR